MADSNITKKALAEALKELMLETPFAKISVADICGKCNMNRKSFYYHFKDKYDLVNWIFDMEFFSLIEKNEHYSAWDLLENMCKYLYDNKKFYKCALKIRGQNSLEDHFIELLTPVMERNIREILSEENMKINDRVLEFHIDFCIDAFVGVIRRWIQDSSDTKPEEFLELARSALHMLSIGLKKENI